MGFGFRFTKTTAFTDSAKRYNPKLFASLQTQESPLVLMETPKVFIEQFATNFEEMLGDVEGAREPMRTNSALPVLEELTQSSAA
ncbi:MAG: hypothetical protein K2Q32_06655 [Alphaproteobacteria bacterium]|nr:hypothetical protein [Alphaproteobacteria bacterium]